MTTSSGTSKIQSTRSLLKLRLLSERAVYTPGKGKFPVCPICNDPVMYGGDMHEALITKGMVRGNKDADKINSRQNCVIRHNECPDGQRHNPGVGSEWDFISCLKQIVWFETYGAVIIWLNQMKEYFPVVADQVLQRVMFAEVEGYLSDKETRQNEKTRS